MGRRDAGPTIIAIRVSNRLGGHCRGGRPACPSETLKSVGRIRESTGRSGLVGFPAAATATATGTGTGTGTGAAMGSRRIVSVPDLRMTRREPFLNPVSDQRE